MEYAGLFFEIIIFMFAGYVYLFSIGKISTKNSEKQSKAEVFRKDNSGWMRIASLALMAIMLVNIYLHITQILG